MYTLGRLGEHEISVGNHNAKRSGFQLSQLSSSWKPFYISFNKITNERGTKTVLTYAHVKWFYGQSEHVYYLN